MVAGCRNTTSTVLQYNVVGNSQSEQNSHRATMYLVLGVVEAAGAHTKTGLWVTHSKQQNRRMEEDDQQHEQLQEQILKDLSALLNTLTSIEEVLLDIDQLTSPQVSEEGQTTTTTSTTTSVYAKQQALIDELGQWRNLFQVQATSGFWLWANLWHSNKWVWI